ncbi:MAG: CmcI family methyltransferase [Puia sp.]|nr:CmcI family methyltransferase [Puia sp.]
MNKNLDISAVREFYKTKYGQTLKNWLIYHHKDIVFDKMFWMGVRILKNPMDLWIYQELIYFIKPDIIVEIGSANGGSTMFIANLLDIIGKGEIFSLDISRENYKVKHNRITEFTGDSLSADIVNKVTSLCEGKKVMVIHDADHTEQSVYDNLVAYSGLVSVGSYFIVEDGIIDLFESSEGIGGHSGPLMATLKFLKTVDHFEIDDNCERYHLTYNPKGFLKRIK